MASKNNKYIGLRFKSCSCDCSFVVTDYYPIYIDGAGEIRTKLFGTDFIVKECCLHSYNSWGSGRSYSKPYTARRQLAASMIIESFKGKSKYRLEPISYIKKARS